MDVQTAATLADLRQQLEAARKDNTACLKELDAARSETDRIRAALQREYDHSKNLESSLTRERSRAEVLAAEVRQSRRPRGHENDQAWIDLLAARDRTDRTHALDAAKFGGA